MTTPRQDTAAGVDVPAKKSATKAAKKAAKHPAKKAAKHLANKAAKHPAKKAAKHLATKAAKHPAKKAAKHPAKKAASSAAAAAGAALSVPGLGPVPRIRRLTQAERVLPNGLRVLAVRQGGVPLVEVRLRVPFAGRRSNHPARAAVLADTALAGTSERTRTGIAGDLQELGASLGVGVDADRLLYSGSTLADRLPALLGLLGEVLTDSQFPAGEVRREKDRLVERLTIARSQAGVLAQEALERRLFGDHPYARDLPQPDAVEAATAGAVRNLAAARVRPDGATLVLVGSLTPARMLDIAESALGTWTGASSEPALPPLPPVVTGPVVLVDRPGSVQSSLRLAGPALRREDPMAPALTLANHAFGGYFSSRWVENIREDKGYTYSPRSSIDHHVLGSTFVAAADVATDVTAPALLETFYELGRIASLPITATELESVRQYALGTLALSVATQAGLASTLSVLVGTGLGLDYLTAQPGRLAAVTIDDVSQVAAQYLAPSRLVTVVVGDAEQISVPVSRLYGTTSA